MLDRLNQAMDHIEQHLDEQIDVKELARIAHTSEYHFRRMFSALAGFPLSEYIRRRKLTQAAAEVLAHEETLLDIAVRYGYGSGEAFARAFKAVHGVGPGEARQTGAAINAQPRMSFRLIVEGSSSMRYRIIEKQAFNLVGLKKRVPLVHEGLNPAIVEFVKGIGKETLRRMEELSDQEPRGSVQVSDNVDDSRAEGTELDYFQGVVTSRDAPDGMEKIEVPAGTWAVFENEGEFPLALQYMWRDVYTQWFPSNPYESRPGPSIVSTKITEDGKRAEAALWIPVERVTGDAR